MNDNRFNYTYSAPTNKERREIESIRRQYVAAPAAENTKTERLKRLDAYVRSTAVIAALTIGIIGVLLFGLGMALVMALGQLALGIVVGLVGAALAASAYFVHSVLLSHGKKKCGEEILRLSEELLGLEQKENG